MKKNPHNLVGTTGERLFAVDRKAERAIDIDARTVQIAFASELPYERYWGIEILRCTPEAVDLSRLSDGAAVLWNHNSSDQIGVVERAWIDADGVCRAVIRFSKSARGEEFFQDVIDGIRTKISVGYRINEAVLSRTGEEGPDEYTVTSWMPYEVSLVSIPADATVGVGRSHGADGEAVPAPVEAAAPAEPATPTITFPFGERNMNEAEIQAAALAAERQRVADINAIADRVGAADLGRTFVNSGKTVDEFRAALIERMPAPAPATPANAARIGMSEGEAKRFSIRKAILAAASGDWSQAGFELEASRATAERTGKATTGFLVPLDVLTRAAADPMNVTTAANGGNLVATDLRASSFIEMLRNKMLLRKAGAQVLGGLVGDVAIPKQTGAGTAYWVAENGDVTGSKQAVGQVPLAPKSVGAFTDITRKLLKQSSMDVEMFVQNDLATQLALAIDLAGFAGTGANGQPTGILNTNGLSVVPLGDNGATIDWAAVVALETAAATANAELEGMSFITTPGIRGALKQTLKAAGIAGYLWGDDNTVNGYKAFATNQMPANLSKGTGTNLHAAIHGDFSQVVIGEWGVLDVQVDTTTLGTSGGVRVITLQDCDIAIRQIAAFSAIKDAKTA